MNSPETSSAPRRLRTGVIGTLAAALIGLTALTGCGGQSASSGSSASASNGGGHVTVFAAASLKNAGDELAKKYKEKHPNAEITWNYGGSSKLVQQIDQGAQADLFISADRKNMDKALKLDAFKDSQDSTVIAKNQLQLVTAPGNPGHISTIQDASDKPVAVCAPEVPCGTLAQQALSAAGVSLDHASQEANVSSVSTKVSQGEVDAGFIYSTDALNMKKKNQDITAIDLKGIEKNEYPAAATDAGAKNKEAKDFYEWLSSSDAKKILEKYGFETES